MGCARAASSRGIPAPAVLALVLLASAIGASAKMIVLNDTSSVVEVPANESLHLDCGPIQKNQANSIRWYKDGQLLDVTKKKNIKTQQIRIKLFQAKDAGVYSCRNEDDTIKELTVTLKYRTDQETGEYQSVAGVLREMPKMLSHKNLTRTVENTTGDIKRNTKDDVETGPVTENRTDVKFAPRFKHPSKMYNMDMKAKRTSIRFRCAAEGNSTPNITWFKNGLPITRPYSPPTYRKWSIILEELSEADIGNYTCAVCNELGCIQHTVVLLVVERYPSKPYIKEGYPGNVTVVVNNSVTLSCPPVSDLEPYQYWIRPKNSSIYVDDGPEGANNPVGDIIVSQNAMDKPEQLTLYNVTKEDEGWYVCVALNALGNTTANSYLTVLESLSPLNT